MGDDCRAQGICHSIDQALETVVHRPASSIFSIWRSVGAIWVPMAGMRRS
jgi:hypothetical protein